MLKFNSSPAQRLAEARFGLSLSTAGLEEQALADCLELPGFDAVELPLEALPQRNGSKRLDKSLSSLCCHAGRIMDHSVSHNILSAPQGMRESFAAQASALIESAASSGFAGAVLDLGLEAALDDDGAKRRAVSLVKALGPSLLESAPFTLSLPCRAPSLVRPGFPERLARFISDCMIPGVKALLEIHPHDLAAGFAPADSARHLEFHVAAAAFLFNADSGNRLVKAHLAPWIDHLGAFGFKGPYFLCPKSGDRRRIASECEALSKLACSIRKP